MTSPRDPGAQRAAFTAALGDRYTIARELGGGGMSQTFLATERALDRQVVIKALAPHLLEGLSVERFQREILTAARLQHPHVVPVLTAGEIDGVPWFTMPYVEGESLRARLAAGPLPLEEAVGILRDVARALAYAHDHGVIHRDIKPDNVLLSGGSATVTDFGIAKAVTAARTVPGTSAEPAALTQAGMAIGTPAYMAPEQAAADPALDHRADLYAFGALACELLTGKPPFPDRAATALLLAHLHEPPPDLRERRPEVPAELADLVARCLAKAPADRPADAGEILSALASPAIVSGASGEAAGGEAVALSRGAGRPGRAAGSAATPATTGTSRRRPLLLAALVVVVLAAGAWILGLGRPDTLIADGTFRERESLVVADFRAPADDSLLGPTVAEALRADLAQSENLDVLTSATIREVLQRMQRARESLVPYDVAREIATREGARGVVDGEIVRLGSRYVLTARLVAAIDGSELATFREEATSDDDLVPAVGRLSRSVRGKVGESLRDIRESIPLERVTTASLPALRAYVDGVRAQVERLDDEAALARYEEAVALDTAFAMAWRSIAVVLNNQFREPQRARDALERAMSHRDRLTDSERLLLEAYYYMRGASPDAERAIAVHEELLRREPGNTSARNNLGVLYGNLGDYERATATYASVLESGQRPSALLLDNLIQAAYYVRDTALIRRAAAAADSLYPDRGRRFIADIVLAELRGDLDGFGRIIDSVRSNAPSMQVRVQSSIVASNHAIRRGRPDEARTIRSSLSLPFANGNPVAARLLDELVELASAGFIDGPSEAMRARLRRAVLPARVAGIPPAERPWGFVLQAAMVLEDGATADLALEGIRTEAVETSVLQPERVALTDSAVARMAAGQWQDALEYLRRALALRRGVLPGDAYLLAKAHDRAQQPDSAIYWFERMDDYAADPFEEVYLLSAAAKRLGELYDARGDVDAAIAQYERFVKTWEVAEPRYQPVVADVRARIARLRQRQDPG